MHSLVQDEVKTPSETPTHHPEQRKQCPVACATHHEQET